MVRKVTRAAISISLLFWLTASANLAFAAKDESRVNGDEERLPPSPLSPFSPNSIDPSGPNGIEEIPDDQHNFELPGPADTFEFLEPEEIPVVVSIELNLDIAKRALDALAEVRDKYTDQGIEAYETLEEFVSETRAGKRLEQDVQTFGFTDVTDWNNNISSVGFAYTAVTDGNEEDEIRQQISEVQIDSEIDQDSKTRMISSLEAMIASDGNKSIIRQLMRDEYYSERLKLLEETE